LYASTKEDGVYKSQDGGRIWTGMGLAGTRADWVAVQPDDCDVAYAVTFGTGVHKTTDGGLNWQPANGGLDDLYLYTLAMVPDGQTLYVGTSRNGVYKSVNSGGTWAPMNVGIPAETGVDALVIDPSNAQVIYAGTWGQGVYRTTDGGSVWSAANSGLGDLEVYALAIDPGDPEIVYAGTHTQGVYRSGDGAGSWSQDGLAGRVVYTVMVGENGSVLAGTDDSGDGDVVIQRSVAGAWEALEEQPDRVSAIRNLSICEPALLAGAVTGAWWYASD
jgi:photosystem II stability/assembly factor-like uncharacterized protein